MYSLLLTNAKLLPYNINNDTLNLVFKLMSDGNLSYQSDVEIKLYTKYDGVTTELVTTVLTNDYGASTILYATNSIPNRHLKTTIYWTEATINGRSFKSNIIRVNFLEIVEPEPLIIDANLNGNINRSSYQIYDAQNNRSTALRIKRP